MITRILRLTAVLAGLILALPVHAVPVPATPLAADPQAAPAVVTRSYTNERTGANLQETTLTTANVQQSTFGKLFERIIDGQMYAQPLYVPNLVIPGKGLHNVVYVATQKNKVYAFDADDPAASAPLWEVSLGAYGVSAEREFGTRYGGEYKDITPYVGILSTPVIDVATNTIYVVPFIKLGTLQYAHRLHALDLRTGQDKTGSPVTIQASIAGTGNGSAGGVLGFDSRKELQRSALLLDRGVIYIAFAGYADTDPYHGWVLGYDAATLQQVTKFCVTPDEAADPVPGDANDGEGGIWMGGHGISTDAQGNLYLVTANGNWNASQAGGRNYGTTLMKLNPTRPELTVASWFTPYDYNNLNIEDTDLGTTGAILIPGTNVMVTGSKAGKLYVVNRNDMGGLGSEDPARPGYDRVIAGKMYQTFKPNNTSSSRIHGSPIYWEGAGAIGKRAYVWPVAGPIKALSFNATTFNTTAAATGTLSTVTWPGGILALSANGNAAASGVVWAAHGLNGSANNATQQGMLRAFDARTLVELWNSRQNQARDNVGNFAKFNPPLVVDGKVFVGSFGDAVPASDRLVAYGLLKPAIVRQPVNQIIRSGGNAAVTVAATGAATLSYQWYRGASGTTSQPITGATSSTLTLTNPAAAQTVWARVTNSAGSADSAAATISVIHPVFLPLAKK